MIFDDIDLKILTEFLKLGDKQTSTWKIMKTIYKDGRDTEHMKIKKRIERMGECGLFKINETKSKTYSLIGDKVLLDKIPLIKKSISVKVDGKWEIFEI